MENRTPVTADFIESMPDLIVNHTINVVLGVIFGLFNIPLFITLISTKTFRHKYLVLLVLCIADATNCMAIILMGINRVSLYSDVVRKMSIPVRDSWDCAMEPWLWFRGVGDLWPPIVQVFIGIERATAVFTPYVYNRIDGMPLRILMMCCSAIYVAGVMAYGFTHAREEKMAIYYCGRKEAFSTNYGKFIYVSNVVCYTFGFLVCFMAFIKCIMLKEVQAQSIQRVRYTLMISFVSTVLVSIPNLISLLKQYLPIANAISKPSVYASSVNSGLNFFVYLTMNPEFRERFNSVCHIEKKERVTLFEISTTADVLRIVFIFGIFVFAVATILMLV